MSKILSRSGWVGFGLLWVASAALANDTNLSFSYWVKVPQTANTCDQEAILLGQRFAQATKLTVTGTTCQGVLQISADGKTYSLYSLVVSYQGANEVQPYSALFGSDLVSPVPTNSSGAYTTYDACMADLANQSTAFQAATGLGVVTAFCQASSIEMDSTYILRIDGFGEPAKKLFSFGLGDELANDSGFVTGAKTLIANQGGVITRETSSAIYYYAPYAVNIQERSLGYFRNAQECTEQLDDARAIFTKGGSTNVYAECLPFGKRGSEVRMQILADGFEDVTENSPIDNIKYFSYAECRADRQRVLDQETSMGFKPLGAICQPSVMGMSYEMNVYSLF